MKRKKLLVVGSVNTDMVVKSHSLPKPGETVLGGTFFMNAGGKGANQAVAAARLGADVTFICKIGNDAFGETSKKLFENEGIDTSYVLVDPDNASGVALITVDHNAENCIVVAPGANANLHASDVPDLPSIIEQFDYILMQLEIPLETIQTVADIAYQKNIPVILNPAPAKALPNSLLSKLYLITPNETEAEIITGIKVIDEDTALLAAKKMHELGVHCVIITLGAKGAFIYKDSQSEIIPSLKVKAVDTTAAGDIFNGALIVGLMEGRSIKESVQFACKASAISVTRMGAQSSAPYRNEII
ncbi:ribokinase [uncultured Bacteroides sp.]|uniref:ribokinase n=1 Tax=uncultured Bacteroides sp. TaxID=162156 RepID=UPI002AAC24ED|nr:ribokinase [uncultured Bacteroides sp.]